VAPAALVQPTQISIPGTGHFGTTRAVVNFFWRCLARDAVPVRAEKDIHPPLCIPDMTLPHLTLFQEFDVTSAVVGVQSIMVKVTNQKYLTN
jgi:hypothetical protein